MSFKKNRKESQGKFIYCYAG